MEAESPPSLEITATVLPAAAVDGHLEGHADAAVSIRGLTKRYGDLFAVRDLTLDIPKGSVFGLIGPNGAGKTTTFAILASLLRPTAGSVAILGFDPVRQPREVRKRLGYMPDILGVYDGLRVDEYLQFFAASYRVPKGRWKPTIDALLELVDLTTKRDAMVNSLSRGMKQRLSLARALVHDPEVLVLDEPASGLDPRARVELRNLLVELREMGKTIVVSSHILAELSEMCTAVAIMEKGRLLASGTPGELRDLTGQKRQIRVRLVGGDERSFAVADDAEQAELLRRLVAEGEPVLEFTEVGHGLEDLFMTITTGEVQ
ncbi:MAG TPA: ABC transporter ATP-binding protein [Acidimicrobiales bacterium]|jgi:ABC-2 type transport system ATP-binding protein|nr:ABC transporter ATP-binding protein [Acidimicrobiales bacterium]